MNDVISFHDPTPPWTTLFPDAEWVCVSAVDSPPNPGKKSYMQTGRGEGGLGTSPGVSLVNEVHLIPLSSCEQQTIVNKVLEGSDVIFKAWNST